MDNDPRDPQRPPEPPTTPDEPDATPESEVTPEPEAVSEPPTSVADVPASDIESWPSEPPARDAADEPGMWPTEPPTMGEEPYLPPPAAEAPKPEMPSEVEAYPATAPEPPAADLADAMPSEVEAYPATPTEPVESEPAAEIAQAVPAAATQAGESTQCPRCGQENPPGLSFCRNCGQRLVAAGVASTIERPATAEGTMACPRCGTHNRTGVAFCQNCGANLRGTSAGYVPPAVAGEAATPAAQAMTGGAVLGPVVLLIGIVGLVTGYLLPFAFGSGSLFERAFGAGGYGIGFWTAYPDSGLPDQLYFGLAAAVPVLAVLLAVLAIAGFIRARPGMLQSIGLWIALLWSIGLAALFVVAELAGNWSGDIVGMLRDLSPGGIIFFLASLIVLIGTLTRFGRS